MDSFTSMLSAVLVYRVLDHLHARDGIRRVLVAAALIALLIVLLELAR